MTPDGQGKQQEEERWGVKKGGRCVCHNQCQTHTSCSTIQTHTHIQIQTDTCAHGHTTTSSCLSFVMDTHPPSFLPSPLVVLLLLCLHLTFFLCFLKSHPSSPPLLFVLTSSFIFHPTSPFPTLLFFPITSSLSLPLSSILLICNLPPSSTWPALSTPSFILSSSLYPFYILPSLHHYFTLSTLVFPIMQMSVCGGALKSRLGPGSLLTVTWLFHRGQQEGGISTCMCTCAWVSVSVIRCSCPSWALVFISFLTWGWWFLHR